jgi:ketosteroid isomerase-like protein
MADAVADLTAVNRAFASAEFAADHEFFRSYLADGLRFRRASGKVVDKIAFLKDLGAPGNTNERLTARDVEVLPYGADLAVCSLVIDFKGVRGGQPVEGAFRNTRLFVRSEGVWKCALWFNSRE